jgi:hypothetical protein
MNGPMELSSSAMKRCALRRWVAARQAGVKASPSSKAGGWRPGCERLGASLPSCQARSGRPVARESRGIWSACWQPWLWPSWGDPR